MHKGPIVQFQLQEEQQKVQEEHVSISLPQHQLHPAHGLDLSPKQVPPQPHRREYWELPLSYSRS